MCITFLLYIGAKDLFYFHLQNSFFFQIQVGNKQAPATLKLKQCFSSLDPAPVISRFTPYPPHGLVCAFRVVFLLITFVKSGYFSYSRLPVSSNESGHPPLFYLKTSFFLFLYKHYRLLSVKQEQFLKYSTHPVWHPHKCHGQRDQWRSHFNES